MKCPRCGDILGDWVSFCTNCGTKLHKIIKEEIRQEISSEVKEFCTPDMERKSFTPFEKGEIESESGQPIDHRAIEDLNDGDSASGDITLEINVNKTYSIREINNFELRVENGSKGYLENIEISTCLLNLREEEKNSIRRIKPSGQENVYLRFYPTAPGSEIVKICLQYFDSKGNPSFYEAVMEIRIFNQKEERKGRSSIVNVFKGEKILGVLVESNLTEEKRRAEEERKSSYDESKKIWKQLYLRFDEERTVDERERL